MDDRDADAAVWGVVHRVASFITCWTLCGGQGEFVLPAHVLHAHYKEWSRVHLAGEEVMPLQMFALAVKHIHRVTHNSSSKTSDTVSVLPRSGPRRKQRRRHGGRRAAAAAGGAAATASGGSGAVAHGGAGSAAVGGVAGVADLATLTAPIDEGDSPGGERLVSSFDDIEAYMRRIYALIDACTAKASCTCGGVSVGGEGRE